MPVTYPTFNHGIISQYPYKEADEWVTAEASVPAGFSYTAPQQETVLRRWVLQYPAFTGSETTTLQTFFNSMRGRLGEFEFTDDQGTTWTHTRFDMDALVIRYIDVAHNSIEVRLSAEAN
jgi:hypothetical protein